MSEGIAALAALDGEAVPDADDLPAVEEGVFGIPRDGLGCVGPAFLLAYGLGKIEVEARELSVVTDVAVWGKSWSNPTIKVPSKPSIELAGGLDEVVVCPQAESPDRSGATQASVTTLMKLRRSTPLGKRAS